MNSFRLQLLDGHGNDEFDHVSQFIAADADGSFGLLAGHAHCVAVLRHGLARFRSQDGPWRYLAMPGGVLRFADQKLTVTTVRYFLGEEPENLCHRLAEEMARTDSDIHLARSTLSEIERSLFKRLTELAGHATGGF